MTQSHALGDYPIYPDGIDRYTDEVDGSPYDYTDPTGNSWLSKVLPTELWA